MTKRTRDFDLTGIQNVDITGFTLSMMTGRDSLDATGRSLAPDGKPVHMFTWVVRSNLIADAIVAVDGKEVIRPYTQWEDWSVRTQAFVERAFDSINGVTNGEMETFLDKHGLKPSAINAQASQPG